METINITTLNEDGSVAFQGTLNKTQASFILGVGINFLLSEGALALQDEEDDDDDLPEGTNEGPDTLQ